MLARTYTSPMSSPEVHHPIKSAVEILLHDDDEDKQLEAVMALEEALAEPDDWDDVDGTTRVFREEGAKALEHHYEQQVAKKKAQKAQKAEMKKRQSMGDMRKQIEERINERRLESVQRRASESAPQASPGPSAASKAEPPTADDLFHSELAHTERSHVRPVRTGRASGIAVPIDALDGVTSSMDAMVRMNRDEALTGCAIGGRDGLPLRACGDVDGTIFARAVRMLAWSSLLRDGAEPLALIVDADSGRTITISSQFTEYVFVTSTWPGGIT